MPDETAERALRTAVPDLDDEALAPFIEGRQLQSVAWTSLIAADHPHFAERAEARIRAWLRTRGV